MPSDAGSPLGSPVVLMAKLDFDTASGELLGKEFGPYRLVRRLGVGGMAETYEAIRQGPSGFTQRVCLKLVLPFFRDDEEFLRLFEREARLAARLRHGNIVGVIDFGEIAGRSYMALELVDGVDLQVLLDAQSAKRLSHEYVALLGHELAAALDHAHNPPRESDFDGSRVSAIVHRDISPSNVLISRHGEILLTDFGVAKAVTGSSRKQSAVKGKIPYMSPEQLRAEQIDGRADLFGVGVVLFEALAGRRPFEGAHDPATIMQILQGDHPALCALAPGAPPALCEVIESLIAPDRNERPESAAALIDLLDAFVPTPRVRRHLGKMVAELRPEQESPISGHPPARGDGDTELRGDEAATEREKRTSGIVGAGESQAHLEAHSAVASPEPAPSDALEAAAPAPRRKRSGLVVGSSFAIGIAVLALGGAGLWLVRGGAGAPSLEAVTSEAVAVTPEVTLALPVSDEAEREVAETEREASELNEGQESGDPKGVAEAEASAEPPRANEDAQATRASPTKQAAASAKRSEKQATAVPPADLTVVVFPWGNVWINGKTRGSAPLKNVLLKPGRYRISVGQGRPTETRTVRLRPGQRETLQFDLTK